MKILNLKSAGLLIALSIISCNVDKKAELAGLKKKHDAISEQIKQLESEISASDTTIVAEINSPKILVKEMSPETFNHFIEVQGKLDGEDNLGISAKAPGTVERIHVKMGDKVSKGQILAQLDDAVLQNSLKQMTDNFVFANELYEKQKKLWDQKIGSEIQFLTAKNNKESLENSIRTLQDQIDMMRITSPINGTVEEVAIKIGQSVSPGFPIFRVVNFNSVKVIADIAESYSSRINVGDDVLLYFPDLQREMTAKISSVSKFIGSQNRTFQIEVRLKPELNNFKANMIVILKINDYRAENVMVVPINLLQNDQEGSFVFVAEKGNSGYHAKKYPVKVGQFYNGMTEVTGGLKAGDLLITAGQLELQDGQLIRL